jgi:type IV secretory pathway ATPase VirB11/archaellum biosynthesis ATPase
MSEDKAQKAKKEEDIKEDSKLEEVELNDEKEIKTVLKKEDNKKEKEYQELTPEELEAILEK